MSELDLKREDIGNCRDCGASTEGVDFYGHIDRESVCSHFKNDDGWWLRIDHKFDIFAMPNDQRLPDVVGELLCPTCNAAASKRFDELMAGFQERE